jgi:hypothetical protein
MRLAASHMQFLHELAASAVQSCQFFESKRPEHLFELKMRKPFKNLRIFATYVLAGAYPSTLRDPIMIS